LVAVGYASNAVGTINDVQRIAELAHGVGAWIYVDSVHYTPHGPIIRSVRHRAHRYGGMRTNHRHFQVWRKLERTDYAAPAV
jgi:hypothetical protein